MAYGEKYYSLVHDQKANQTYRVALQETGYGGSSTRLEAETPGFKWTAGGSNKDVWEPILNSKLEWYPLVYSANQSMLTDIAGAQEGDYRLELSLEGTVLWTGNVIPDAGKQHQWSYPSQVTIKANDGLDALKGIDYDAPFTTSAGFRRTVGTILSNILSDVGFGYALKLAHCWDYNGSSSGQTDLTGNVDIDIRQLVDFTDPTQANNRLDEYAVLEMLLTRFNLRILQWKESWHIIQPDAYINGSALFQDDSGGSIAQPFSNTTVGGAGKTLQGENSYVRWRPILKSGQIKYDHQNNNLGLYIAPFDQLDSPQSVTLEELTTSGDEQVSVHLEGFTDVAETVTVTIQHNTWWWDNSQQGWFGTSRSTDFNVNDSFSIDILTTALNAEDAQDLTITIEMTTASASSYGGFTDIDLILKNTDEVNSAARITEATSNQRASWNIELNEVTIGQGPAEFARGYLRTADSQAAIINGWKRVGASGYINMDKQLLAFTLAGQGKVREVLDGLIRGGSSGAFDPIDSITFDSKTMVPLQYVLTQDSNGFYVRGSWMELGYDENTLTYTTWREGSDVGSSTGTTGSGTSTGGGDGDLTVANPLYFDGSDVLNLRQDATFFELDGNNALSLTVTDAEWNQVQNIDSVSISNTQWGYVGDLDQGLSQSDSPVFQNMQTYITTRTMPTTEGDCIDIGTISLNSGGIAFELSVAVSDSGFSVGKLYYGTLEYNNDGNWYVMFPLRTNGNYGGNDFEVDLQQNGTDKKLRIRRTAGTTSGTAYITLRLLSDWTGQSFTESTTTTSPSASPSDYLINAGNFYQVGDKVGLGITNPSANFETDGVIGIQTGSNGYFSLRSNSKYHAIRYMGSADNGATIDGPMMHGYQGTALGWYKDDSNGFVAELIVHENYINIPAQNMVFGIVRNNETSYNYDFQGSGRFTNYVTFDDGWKSGRSLGIQTDVYGNFEFQSDAGTTSQAWSVSGASGGTILSVFENGEIQAFSTLGVNVKPSTHTFEVDGTAQITGEARFNSDVRIDRGQWLYFNDTQGSFPTAKGGFYWNLNNDQARIWAQQPSSDDIDFVFEVSDNVDASDRFIFFIDSYQGSAYDGFPLLMDGNKVVFNHPDPFGDGNPSIDTDFYIIGNNESGLSPYFYGDATEKTISIGGTQATNRTLTMVDQFDFGSETYASGWAGNGVFLGYRNSQYELELDSMRIRYALFVKELIVDQMRSIMGTVVQSAANGKIESVSGTAPTETITIEDPEGNNLNPFVAGDIVVTQQFDADSSTVVKVLVREVDSVSNMDVTLRDADSTAPADAGSFEAGDYIVQIGHISDTSRQNVIYSSAVDAGAPFIRMLSGVDSWGAFGSDDTIRSQFGDLSALSVTEFPSMSGHGLYGDNVYLKGTLQIDGGQGLGNLSDANTTELTDGANLGGTADWSGVNDDNGNKPADNADVTANNTAADIVNLPATVSGAGLYATGTYLGYSDGTNWRAYLSANGEFVLTDSNGTQRFAFDAPNNTASIAGFGFNGSQMSSQTSDAYGLVYVSTDSSVTSSGSFNGTPSGYPVIGGYYAPNGDYLERTFVHIGETYAGAWTGRFGFSLCPGKNSNAFMEFARDFSTGALTAQIAGWNFTSSRFYNGNIEMNTSGYIRHTSDYWRFNNDGSGQLAGGDISWDSAGNITTVAKITASSGSIANWSISSGLLTDGDLYIGTSLSSYEAAGRLLVGYWNSSSLPIIRVYGPSTNDYVSMLYNSGTGAWGLQGYQSGYVFQLGNKNQIGSWNFDASRLYAFDANNTGLELQVSSGIGTFTAQNNGTTTIYLDTDGRLYAGGGDVELSEDGIRLEAGTAISRKVIWGTASSNDDNLRMYLTGTTSAGLAWIRSPGTMHLQPGTDSSTYDTVYIESYGTTGAAGNLSVDGNLSKSSGSFRIDHPIKENHTLWHSFVESPTAGDNLYRYHVTAENGVAVIKLPLWWKPLNRNAQIWVSPDGHFGRAYGEYDRKTNIVTITADADGDYHVLLLGTRQDPMATKAWKGVERPWDEHDERRYAN